MLSYLLAFFRITLSLIFAWSFVGKLQDYSSFVETIDRFKLLPNTLHHPIALALLGCELTVLGTMILGGELLLWGFLSAALLLTVFIVAMTSVLLRKIRTPCNCFGSSQKPISLSDIVRNIILALVSLSGYSLLIISETDLVDIGWLSWGLVTVTSGIFVMILVQLGEIVQVFR